MTLTPGRKYLIQSKYGQSLRQANFNVMNFKLAISFRELFCSICKRVHTVNIGPDRKRER
jgi:hypothetical protein